MDYSWRHILRDFLDLRGGGASDLDLYGSTYSIDWVTSLNVVNSIGRLESKFYGSPDELEWCLWILISALLALSNLIRLSLNLDS